MMTMGKTEHMSIQQYRAEIGVDNGAKPVRDSKYNAKPCVIDGNRFPSKIEAAYYLWALDMQRSGEISYFLRQVPIYLPGGIRYVFDFLLFEARSILDQSEVPRGWHKYIDVKGHETKEFKMKRNQVHAIYPQIFIHCVTRPQIPPHFRKTVDDLMAAGLAS